MSKTITIYKLHNNNIDDDLEEIFPDCYIKDVLTSILCIVDVPSEEKTNQFILNGMNNLAKKINKNFEYEIDNSRNRIQTRAIIRPISDEDEKQICQLSVKCFKEKYFEMSEIVDDFIQYEKDIPPHIKEQVAIPYENKNEAERKIKFILQCIKKHYQ